MRAAQRTKPLYTQAAIEAAMQAYLAQRLAKPAPCLPHLRIGDKVTAKPYANAFWDGCGSPPPVEGEVVYIHPSGRWAMARFSIGKETIRECFLLQDMHIEKGE